MAFDEVISFRIDKKNYVLLKSFCEKNHLNHGYIMRSALTYFFESKKEEFEDSIKELVDINKKKMEIMVSVEKNKFLMKRGFLLKNTARIVKDMILAGAQEEIVKMFLENQIKTAEVFEDKLLLEKLKAWKKNIEDIYVMVTEGRYGYVMVPESKERLYDEFQKVGYTNRKVYK